MNSLRRQIGASGGISLARNPYAETLFMPWPLSRVAHAFQLLHVALL